jgi:hypothetical protein
VTSALTCTKTRPLEAGFFYAWETAEGVAGHLLIDAEGSVARPRTPKGTCLGSMRLRKSVGDVEGPDPDPELCRAFLVAASVICQEKVRQGRLPDKITRTFW